MLNYALLKSRPAALRSLTGLTAPEFEALAREVAARYEPAEERRLWRPNRQRRRGAGQRFAHPFEDRLLLSLVWLRVYPTYEVLGLLFGLHKSNVCRTLAAMRPLLREATAVTLCWPTAAQRQRTWKQLLADFPEVTLLLDATEQRIRRPKDNEEQRRHYSGKKKAHTLKTQIAITPDQQIASVSPSVPGSVNDLTLLRVSGLLTPQPAGKALMDAGYQGIRNDAQVAPERIEHAHRASRGHPLTPEQKAENRTLAKARIRIEHTLGEMKVYQVLTQVYRHRRGHYHDWFCIVAGLTNQRRGYGYSLIR